MGKHGITSPAVVVIGIGLLLLGFWSLSKITMLGNSAKRELAKSWLESYPKTFPHNLARLLVGSSSFFTTFDGDLMLPYVNTDVVNKVNRGDVLTFDLTKSVSSRWLCNLI